MASTGSRTKTGCFTCRIRKKKCDEGKPFCVNCRSREIVCHAYDAKPSWMDGMGSWSEIMQSKEAVSIREAAETTYRLRRRSMRAPNIQNTGQKVTRAPNLKRPGKTAHPLMGRPEEAASSNSFPSALDMNPVYTNTSSATAYQAAPTLPPTLSYILSEHITQPQEVNLLHTYLNIIFPLQYSTLTTTSHCSRQWLFENLLHSSAFYNASASIASSIIVLSTTSQAQTPSQNPHKKPSLPPQVLTLQSKALLGLHSYISSISSPLSLAAMSTSSLLQSGMQILAIITQLISFQVMNFTSGGWEVHLSAARRILGLFQHRFLPLYFSPFPTAIMNANAGEHKDQDVGGIDFFVSTFVWVDIISGASFGPSPAVSAGVGLGMGNDGGGAQEEERFEYVELLKMGRWDLKGVMGCQTWVMIAIAEITALEKWKASQMDVGGNLNVEGAEEVLKRGKALENGLRRAIAVLQIDVTSSTWGPEGDDSKDISVIFAHAALVYLYTVLSGPDPQMLDVKNSVERCLQCIEALPASLLIRICWPFTVAASMATEGLYARFRGVLERMGDVGDGSLRKGVGVMEECWRLRAVGDGEGSGYGSANDGKGWWWKNTMEKLRVRILLT